MKYEGRVAEIGIRRALALSQAVTIATTSFASKVKRAFVWKTAVCEAAITPKAT